MRIAAALVALTALVACDQAVNVPQLSSSGGAIDPDGGPNGTPAPTVDRADAFARQYLNNIQGPSFAQGREFCGYFIMDAQGGIFSTDPIPGTLDSCQLPYPPVGAFASWHTHGAYDPRYDNEVPSPPDLISDFELGMDGYVSTPGGRVWRNEYDILASFQICGQGCVAVDPGFVPENEAGIRQQYTVDALYARYQAGGSSGRETIR